MQGSGIKLTRTQDLLWLAASHELPPHQRFPFQGSAQATTLDLLQNGANPDAKKTVTLQLPNKTGVQFQIQTIIISGPAFQHCTAHPSSKKFPTGLEISKNVNAAISQWKKNKNK